MLENNENQPVEINEPRLILQHISIKHQEDDKKNDPPSQNDES